MAICELDHLAHELPKYRYVLVGGAFDPLHDGHLDHFWEAHKLGPLVCAVAPDAERSRPVLLPQLLRLKILNNLSVLEHVTLSTAGITPILEALRPVAYVKGPDWVGRVPADQVACCERLGIRIVHTHDKPQSSTALLDDYQRRLNAAKLEAFEAWVSTQPPAVPWTPVTDYSFEARRDIEGPHAELIRDVLEPAYILDVGCGPGHLVTMLTEAGVSCRGVDLPCFDIRDTSDDDPRQADVVICREVLEHLRAVEVPKAVRNLVRLSTRYVYCTTRFTAKPHLLDFDTRDDLDPTHITLLNQNYMRSLFVLEGCHRRADLEARMDWKGLGRCLVYEVPQ